MITNQMAAPVSEGNWDRPTHRIALPPAVGGIMNVPQMPNEAVPTRGGVQVSPMTAQKMLNIQDPALMHKYGFTDAATMPGQGASNQQVQAAWHNYLKQNPGVLSGLAGGPSAPDGTPAGAQTPPGQATTNPGVRTTADGGGDLNYWRQVMQERDAFYAANPGSMPKAVAMGQNGVPPKSVTASGPTVSAGGSSSSGAASHMGLNPIFGDYINDYMSKAGALANLPFSPYEGDRFAGPSALQNKAFQGIGSLNAPDQSMAKNWMTQGANQVAGAAAGYNPTSVMDNQMFQQGIGGMSGLARTAASMGGSYTPGSFAPSSVGYDRVSVGLNAGDKGTIDKFMSPYQASVNDVLKRRMQEDFAKQDMARKAASVKAGAFGGSRFAIEAAEALKNQNRQVEDMDTTGMQRAWDAAQSSLSGQRAAELQAAMANQGASVQTGIANANNAMQAQQLAEQSRQFGSNLGLQGLNTAGTLMGRGMDFLTSGIGADNASGLNKAQLGITGGNALANLGTGIASLDNTGFQQQQQLLSSQLQAGNLQQAIDQRPLDFAYDQWQESLKYPEQQLKLQQSMIQGLPLNYSGGGGENPLLAALQGGIGSYSLLQQLLGGKK